MTVLSDDMAQQIREGREAAVDAFLDAVDDWIEAKDRGYVSKSVEEARERAGEALRTALDCVVGI